MDNKNTPRSGPTTVWRSDLGQSVEGWLISSDVLVREEIVPTRVGGFWSKEWRERVEVLGLDGSLWVYTEEHEEMVNNPEKVRRYLSRA